MKESQMKVSQIESEFKGVKMEAYQSGTQSNGSQMKKSWN